MKTATRILSGYSVHSIWKIGYMASMNKDQSIVCTVFHHTRCDSFRIGLYSNALKRTSICFSKG